MIKETYTESVWRWHLYRRWRKRTRERRYAEYLFHTSLRKFRGSFVDLGANVGDVTKAVREFGGTVIAFEPDPAALRVLKDRFGDDPKVTIIEKAVGASNRVATFYRRAEADRDLLQTESTSLFMRQKKHIGGGTFQVEVIDIAEFLRGLSEPIGVMKMDIEGAEVEVLNSILDAGLHKRIGQILVETHERFSPELREDIDKIRGR